MGTGKKKIEIKKKEKESDRMVTFSKRKQGLFRKASQLKELTGSDSEVAILVFSPAGNPYTSPHFDSALSRYFSALGDRGGATTAAADHDGNDASAGSSTGLMWLDSVDGGANTGDHANGGSVGMRLNSVESFVVVGGGGGGEDIGDCSRSENFRCIREWLNCIEVEGIEKTEDLLVMKQRLENIKEKVMKKVDDAICSSYFV